MKSQIRNITYGGILSAVILIATLYLSVPLPSGVGYINFGDGAIFTAAAILGPFAAICAALGSGLADFLVGAPQYIPATVIIKGCMGLLAGFVLKKWPKLNWKKLLGLFIACEIVMIGGYFVTECLIYDPAIAVANVPFNGIQGLFGIVLGLAIVPQARKIKV